MRTRCEQGTLLHNGGCSPTLPCDTLCVRSRQSFGGNHADYYSPLPTHGGVCEPSSLLLRNGGRSPIVVVLVPCAALRVGGCQVICAYH